MATTTDIDAMLREEAEKHYGLFNRGMAYAAGHDKKSLRRAVDGGKYVQVHPSTFAFTVVPDSMLQRLEAARLEINGWIWRRSAGEIFGLTGCPTGHVEIVTTGSVPRADGISIHRTNCLPPEDRTTFKGLPITTPTRTLLDLAGVLDESQFRPALLSAINLGLVTPAELFDQADRAAARGRPGSAMFREAIDGFAVDERFPDSELEKRCLEAIELAGFPKPEIQRYLSRGGRTIGRIDLIYGSLRIAIECDSWEWHRSKMAFYDDRTRGNELAALGWLLLRFTWRDVEHPAQFLDALGAAIALRSA